MTPSRFYRPCYVARYGAAFALAVAFVLDRETEFNHDGTVRVERDPADPGGTTVYGIDQGSHQGVDVAHLSEAQAVEIYHGREWAWIGGDKLPGVLALAMLDTCVNPGRLPAIHWLQAAVGVVQDGVLGPATWAAVAALTPAGIIEAADGIQDARESYYRARPAFLHDQPFRARFLAGWLDRVALTRAAIKAG